MAFSKSESNYIDQSLHGMTLTEIEGRLNEAANPGAVQRGIERGDIIVNKDAQGRKWYHLPKMVSGNKKGFKTVEQASTEQQLKDDPDAVNALFLDMKDESWLESQGRLKLHVLSDSECFALPASSSSRSSGSTSSTSAQVQVIASDATLAKVQQAYDAVSCATASLKSKAFQLKGLVDNDTIKNGLEKVSLGNELSSVLELMLLAERGTLVEAEVKEKMIDVGNRYQYLKMKEVEISSLHRSLFKKRKEAPESSEGNKEG